MAIGHISVLDVDNDTSATVDGTVTIPNDGSVVVGDLLIWSFTYASSSRTNTVSGITGYTELPREADQSGHSSQIWYKVAESGDLGDSITVTMSSTGVRNILMLCKISGAHPTTPLDSPDQYASVHSASSLTKTPPTVTSVDTGSREVHFVFDTRGSTPQTTSWTPPSGITLQGDEFLGGSSQLISMAVGDSDAEVSGTIGGTNWTAAPSAAIGSAWTLAIKSAGTTYNDNPSDAEGLTDTRTITHTMSDTINNPIGLTDTLSVTQTHRPSFTDALGLTDTRTVENPSGPIDLAMALSLTDFTSTALSMPSSILDPFGITDFISVVLQSWEEDHVPHSSSGFGEIYIDRIFLIEREKATETNDGKMSLAGQESSPPTTVALVTFLHGQVAGMQEGKLVPVIFRDKAERNAYYVTGSISSDLTDHQNEVATADWTIELTRMGSEAEIDIQSRLTGAVRQNDFSLSGQKWHAPAMSHYAYHTGSTLPTSVTRTSTDGSIKVYLDIPTNIHPRWGCAVSNYHGGRVRIKDTLEVAIENEVEGLNRNISPTGWSMNNGLVNVTATASAGVINVQYYNGTAWVDDFWKIQVAGSNIAQWSAATIIRNDFEQCVMRLTAAATNAGRTTVDIGLKRGSRFIEGYMQNSTSATLKVAPNNSTASTSGTGYQIATSGTHRHICGSARTFVVDNTNGGISKASTLTFDFWIGAVINAASPATGDQHTDLRNQYIGSMPEYTYGVRR